jgi:hypothetical protein
MIRRLFWLSAGAVIGVSGYRKVTAKINNAKRALHPEREIAAFARDVREGARMYRADQDQRPPRLEYSDPGNNGTGRFSRPGGVNRYRASRRA